MVISFIKLAAFLDLPIHLGQTQTQKFTDAQTGSEKKNYNEFNMTTEQQLQFYSLILILQLKFKHYWKLVI